MPPSDFVESSPTIADEIPAILASLERIELRQQKTLVEVMIRLNAIESAVMSLASDESDNGDGAPPASSELDWEAQKRKIYAAHGMPIEDEAPEVSAPTPPGSAGDELGTTVDPAKPIDASNGADNGELELPTSEDSNDKESTISAADQKEIAQLKEELREKLRQAEMELSISRAKISRENALLEERKAELDQLAKRLKTEFGSGNQQPQKISMLDRLNRHMQTLKRTTGSDSSD